MSKYYAPLSLHSTSHAFLDELRLAQFNQPSSLSFHQYKLTSKKLNLKKQTFQILIIGGSNLSTATAQLNNNQLILSRSRNQRYHRLKSGQDFFNLAESLLDPKCHLIIINLAFPLKPIIPTSASALPDGQLLQSPKRHQLSELIGKPIGLTLAQYLTQKHHKTYQVAVANDVVCLSLAASYQNQNHPALAMVLGTGINTAIISSTSIINLESGNFNRFTPSQPAKLIDKKSQDPGAHLFEKEISGAYLYEHFNYWLKQNHLPLSPLKSTQALTPLLQSGNSDIAACAQAVFNHSAQLVAAHLAAIGDFLDQATLSVFVEGSLYWHNHYYQHQIDHSLASLSSRRFIFSRPQDSPFVGTARLLFPQL